MPTFEHSELLPEHEILQYKIPTATEEANHCSGPEENEAEHVTELYQINDWKYCCKLLILRSARVLARDRMRLPGAASLTEHWLACAVKATDMSAPRPAASIISTPLRSITTRRVWAACSAISPGLNFGSSS